MVKDKFVTVRGLELHYREWSRRGTPVVFLHGLSSSARIFDKVAVRLAESCRVIAVDQRGHGESSKPDEGYDFESIAADLAGLMDALKIKRAVVAGHSWGGGVALRFAARYSERAKGLILIDGGFFDLQGIPGMTWAHAEERMAPMDFEDTPVERFREGIKGFAGKWWSPWVEEVILASFFITPEGGVRRRLTVANHMKILRALWEQRPGELYPLVRCPTLLLPAVMESAGDAGRVEQKKREVGAALAGLKKGKVVWFRETVHDIPMQRARRLANVIGTFIGDIQG